MSKTVRNPVIGHWVTFLQTGAQTNGKLLQIEYGVIEPENEPAIPLHMHLKCEERFEIVTGQLVFVLGGIGRLWGYKAKYTQYSGLK